MDERASTNLDAADPQQLLARARVALRSGSVARALADLEAAHTLASARLDQALVGAIMVELARALRAQGTPDQALLCIDKAVEAARAGFATDMVGEARLLESELLRGIGDANRARARAEEAVARFDEAFAQARDAKQLERALELAERLRAACRAVVETSAAGIRSKALSAPEPPRDRRLLEQLHEASRRLVAERDPDKVVASVLDLAIEATGAERGFVLEGPEKADPSAIDSEKFRVVAARNFDHAEVRRPEFKLSRTVMQQALETKRPVFVHDAGLDAALAERTSVRTHKLKSIVCIPIESGRDVRAVLYLDNRFGKGAFAEADVAALNSFAAHAAVALENARLHEKSAREHRELEKARAELAAALEKERSSSGEEIGRLRAQLAERSSLGEIVGASPSMQEVYRLIEKVRDSDVPLLVRGESGVGKELVARAVHFGSPRRDAPFVSESCAALPETLLESLLFGHEAGAFTGATGRRAGLFELAGAGTLFLDEVGELSPSSQSKLLRVLADRKVRRLGGSDEVPVRARIIAATHRDLEAMVRGGTFREDLYYRLNVVSLRVPPLRERREDLPSIIEALVARNGAGELRFAPDTMRALVNHSWPGNVRELENELRRLVALKVTTVTVDDLSPAIRPGAPRLTAGAPEGPPVTLLEGERKLIVEALKYVQGNKVKAAELLGVSRGKLWHKMRQMKVRPEEYGG